MIRHVLVAVLLAGAAGAGAADSTDLTATGVVEFTAAYRAWDGAGFATAAQTFTQAGARERGSATNHYWRGVAEFHRLLYLLGEPGQATNRQAIAQALDHAAAALQRAVQLEPNDGESHALLSTVYGLSIGVNPARALWLGPRLMDQETQARKLSPDNPRVLYLAGMNRYHGPAMLGGKAEGLKLLAAAAKLFAAEAARPGHPLAPRWGHSTCLVYIGKTYAALGQPVEATQYFRQALEVNPYDQLARAELERRTP